MKKKRKGEGELSRVEFLDHKRRDVIEEGKDRGGVL